MKSTELYSAGNLTQAIAAAVEDVKKAPTDTDKRSFLAELLCVAGELERADSQLDAIARTTTGASPGLPLMRQLVRAERARTEFHSQGRLPEFLTQPTPAIELALKASIAIREGRMADASALVEEAEAARAKPRATVNGKSFEDLRDCDDLTAGVLEVLTSTGKYYWVPLASVASLQFEKAARPIDLVWRPASLSVRGGPDGRVFLSMIYASHGLPVDDMSRLGRRTDWIGAAGEPVRGVGLRTLLAGDDAMTLLEVETLAVDPA
ncbi:MAG TPA: type VI secretion system accessory protein TagJ [Planctomycetota bacterium]|nr:type VI secretion system accessory protein TagJ [Planctomycetota bacterium]